jgi:hypothetical protein
MVFDNFFMILCAFLPTLPRAVLTRPSLCEKQPRTRKTHTVFYIKTKRLFRPDFARFCEQTVSAARSVLFGALP